MHLILCYIDNYLKHYVYLTNSNKDVSYRKCFSKYLSYLYGFKTYFTRFPLVFHSANACHLVAKSKVVVVISIINYSSVGVNFYVHRGFLLLSYQYRSPLSVEKLRLIVYGSELSNIST